MYYSDIFRELEALRRNLEETFGSADLWRRPFSRVAFLPGVSARTYPMINVSGDENNVYVDALAPSVDPEKLEVSVTGNTLTVSGEKVMGTNKVTDDAYHRCERATGKFVRTIDLPVNVDSDKIQAEYTNGMLRIILPKAASAKPKRIAITAG